MMGVVGNCSEAMRKFLRIRIPITDASEPARIYMEHLYSQRRGICDHAAGKFIVDGHASAPAVIHHQRVIGILPSLRIAKRCTHPFAQNVAGIVVSMVEPTHEHNRRLKRLSRLKASSEGRGIGIQPYSSVQ